jgi:zinc-binding alcohol dehydrogenase family protein
MRAVAYLHSRPVEAEDVFVDVELPRPVPGPRDLLVKVEAVSVNPVDMKTRQGTDPKGTPKVLGYDAAGTVEAVGSAVSLFKPGDAVWYAGSIMRPGTDSEFHLVDERIVGRKPKTLSFAEAAALPLTAITAWELLFDRIGVKPGDMSDKRSLLIIGGAGGVGSAAIQLARALTGLTVIATASRPETIAWVKQLGAHHVVDHSSPMAPQLTALGMAPDIVAMLAGAGQHAAEACEVVAPEGHIGVIEGTFSFDAPSQGKLRMKSVALHFESMFTRSNAQTSTMVRQHELLDEVTSLVESGKIRTTLAKTLSPINAANMREAHRLVETGRTIGKIVLAGWG